jgi:carboxyl-terminal processing protease
MSKKVQVIILSSSMLIIVFALIGGLGVHAASDNNSANSPDNAYTHMEVYSEVLHRIRTEYVEEPNMHKVTDGALHGLLESLDANSSYLTPDEFKQYQEMNKDGKAGIGATVSKRFGYAAVVSVLPNGPADKAGIGEGDILETIDGASTHDLSLAAIRAKLHGEQGSRMEATIIRTRKIEPQKITIVRELVTPPAITGQLMGDVGYIKALTLDKGKAQDIASQIKSLETKGAKKLVLDLRDDSQGDETEGVAVANLFIGNGQIASLKGQKYNPQTFNADPSKKVTDMPLAVLVNRGTAGAAEIVAGAVEDDSRGDIVGSKTFGDGSVQKTLPMEDGAALILSVAKYYTPKGSIIQDTGITPNVKVASSDDLAFIPDDDDGGAATTPEEQQKKETKPKEDDQLKKAIDVLKAKTGPKS